MPSTVNRHRWKPDEWWECNIAVSTQGWRLLCRLESCTSPRHWNGEPTALSWAVTMFCAVEPAEVGRAPEMRARLVGNERQAGWFRARDLTYTAALARELGAQMDQALLSKLTEAIEASADLLWREYGLVKASEYSVFGMICGPTDAVWWFGLLLRTDGHGRIEFGLATTTGELESLVEIKPSDFEQGVSAPH